jgi:hypothetical protein
MWIGIWIVQKYIGKYWNIFHNFRWFQMILARSGYNMTQLDYRMQYHGDTVDTTAKQIKKQQHSTHHAKQLRWIHVKKLLWMEGVEFGEVGAHGPGTIHQ